MKEFLVMVQKTVSPRKGSLLALAAAGVLLASHLFPPWLLELSALGSCAGIAYIGFCLFRQGSRYEQCKPVFMSGYILAGFAAIVLDFVLGLVTVLSAFQKPEIFEILVQLMLGAMCLFSIILAWSTFDSNRKKLPYPE